MRHSGSYNGTYGQPAGTYNTVNQQQALNSVEAPIIQQRVKYAILIINHYYKLANVLNSAPIIQETVRNDRVVEVQPVIHRSGNQNQ